MDSGKPQFPCRQYIPDIVIHINRFFRIDTKPVDQQLVDLFKGFADFFFPRDQAAVEPMKEII